jgi:hypothetical protein
VQLVARVLRVEREPFVDPEGRPAQHELEARELRVAAQRAEQTEHRSQRVDRVDLRVARVVDDRGRAAGDELDPAPFGERLARIERPQHARRQRLELDFGERELGVGRPLAVDGEHVDVLSFAELIDGDRDHAVLVGAQADE